MGDISTRKARPLSNSTIYVNDLVGCLQKSLSAYGTEHYPSPTYGVYPTSTSTRTGSADASAEERRGDSCLALLLVSNKYSPSNYWNGRWRSSYLLVPGTGTASLSGSIDVTVHYYEDGNVSLTTHKPVNVAELSLPASPTAAAETVVKRIAAVEKAYQIELNTAFAAMNEEGFKGLRRQLPVTRQKIDWDKVGGYRLGSDLRGGLGGVVGGR